MNIKRYTRKVFSNAFPVFQKYLWFVAPARKVAALDMPEKPFLREHNVEILRITDALLEAIDKSRPGYAKQASKYLADGHIGLAATLSGEVLGMVWFFCNHTSRRVRACYFPLDPKMAWLHALWVHPNYRGVGLSQVLIIWGARLVIEVLGGDALIEANVLPENVVSVRVFRKLGFAVYGYLYLIRWARWSLAWKAKTNDGSEPPKSSEKAE